MPGAQRWDAGPRPWLVWHLWLGDHHGLNPEVQVLVHMPTSLAASELRAEVPDL